MNHTIQDYTLPFPLSTGDYVVLQESVDRDYEDNQLVGYSAETLFEGQVKVFNPTTNSLEFREENRTEDIGLATFKDYVWDCETYEVHSGENL